MGSRSSRVTAPQTLWQSGLFASPVLDQLRVPERPMRSKSTVDEFSYAVTLPNGVIVEHSLVHTKFDCPEWRCFHTICSNQLRTSCKILVTFRVRTLITPNSSIIDILQITDRPVLELVLKRLLPLAFPTNLVQISTSEPALVDGPELECDESQTVPPLEHPPLEPPLPGLPESLEEQGGQGAWR